MTGATSTSAGGGGVDARTLLLLQPSELDNNAAQINPAKIFFFFIFSFPRNRVTGAPEPRRLLGYARNVARRSSRARLHRYRLCIICNDSKICRKNLLTEMQHGGESSSMLPPNASLEFSLSLQLGSCRDHHC